MGGNEISVRASRIVAAVAVVALLGVLVAPGSALALAPEGPRVAPMSEPHGGEVPGQLIVTFEPGVTPDEEHAAVAEHEGRLVDSMPGKATKLVQVDPANVDKLAREIAGEDEVAEVERNHLVGALAFPEDTTPDDSYYSYQWNFGQISVPEAWQRANGAGVVVAVIDTGVAYEGYSDTLGTYVKLPDLAGTSFAPGYDFVNEDLHPNDDNGHGSNVAGTVAQTTNNAASEAGIAYRATIMPVKVLSGSGSGTTFDVAAGIRWAADHGASVINMSLGSSYASSTMQNAITYANGLGVVVVAAAGNCNSSAPFYPASHEGVVSVGAVRYDRTRSYYSNYGPTLDVVAPGGDTSVDQNGDGYGDGILQQTFSGYPTDYGDYFFQGTSMASPHVAAVSALLLGNGLSATEVVPALEHSAVDLGAAGRDDTYGYGEVNAAGALTLVQGPTGAALRAPTTRRTRARPPLYRSAGAPSSPPRGRFPAGQGTPTDFGPEAWIA